VSDRHALIIGAGISGVLTALTLAEHGWAVTVLEARHTGAGSSSRTAAGIRQQFSQPHTVVAMRHAVNWYSAFAKRIGEAVLVQNGYLFLNGDDERHRAACARVAMQRALGLEVECLDAATLEHRFPWVSTRTVVGGTFCPTDGFLHPQVVYNEGESEARSRGAVFVHGAAVERTEHGPRGLTVLHTTRGPFQADLVFDCTNAWTHRLQARLGATVLPVRPLKRYLWFVRRAGSMSRETLTAMPLVITPNGAYGRPEHADSLLIGRKHAVEPDWNFTDEDQDRVEARFSHKSGPDAVPYEVWADLADTLPPLEEFAGITASTCGYYGTTPDENPFLDYDPAVPNLIRLVGFSGRGVMMGPFTARVGLALAEAGHPCDDVHLPEGLIPLAPFKIGRPFVSEEALVI